MTLTLHAVGDVTAFHNDAESMFDHVEDTLKNSDITMGQNERLYTEKEQIAAGPGFTEYTTPENAAALQNGDFDVITFASNHSMDAGPEYMMETADILESLGFEVVGVGWTEDEARAPVIIERDGITIGFLSYASVLRKGHAANGEKAGTAPMRAWTHYHQIDYQPGTPPQRKTFPDRNDLDKLLADVAELNETVDVTILSLHWGIHYETATIAEYQTEVARKAIDAGADMIIGTHPHMLKGIEVYKEKPIFYSLGNFALDMPREIVQEWAHEEEFQVLLDLYDWDINTGPEQYAFPYESRLSMLAEIEFTGSSIEKIKLHPVKINENAQPVIVPSESDAFDEIYEYLKQITSEESLGTEYERSGDVIYISDF